MDAVIGNVHETAAPPMAAALNNLSYASACLEPWFAAFQGKHTILCGAVVVVVGSRVNPTPCLYYQCT